MRVGFGYYWLVCGQSSSENGLDPGQGACDESPTGSLREVIMPRVGFSPGYRLALPPPLGGGGGGRRPGGVGATRRDLRVPPPAERGRAPSPAPTPRAIPTTVHCLGEPGDTPRSPPTLRWVGTITRTDMRVQQGLNPADSQPGTQCTHGWVHANGGASLPGPKVFPPRSTHCLGRAREISVFSPSLHPTCSNIWVFTHAACCIVSLYFEDSNA